MIVHHEQITKKKMMIIRMNNDRHIDIVTEIVMKPMIMNMIVERMIGQEIENDRPIINATMKMMIDVMN